MRVGRRARTRLTPDDPSAYGVLALLVLALLVFFVLPDTLITRADFENNSDWYKARNDVRTTGIQLLGGFVLVVGSYFTAKTFRLSREGHITDRFSKAIEHLGGDEPATRLGGIYALERIMKDAPAEQGSVLEVLTAFVRVEARKPRPDATPPSVEVAAALRVIGRRNPENDPDDIWFPLNLSETDLSYSSMRDGNYVSANFWRTNLEHAYLVRATFRNALLRGAQMHGATIDGADFTGARYDATTEWPEWVIPAELGAVSESPSTA